MDPYAAGTSASSLNRRTAYAELVVHALDLDMVETGGALNCFIYGNPNLLARFMKKLGA